MEQLLNVTSFGNMSRQFLSLLRSEQEILTRPVIGDPTVWQGLLGPTAQMLTLAEAFESRAAATADPEHRTAGPQPRAFPYREVAKLIFNNPRVVMPGLKLTAEIVEAFAKQYVFPREPKSSPRPEQQQPQQQQQQQQQVSQQASSVQEERVVVAEGAATVATTVLPSPPAPTATATPAPVLALSHMAPTLGTPQSMLAAAAMATSTSSVTENGRLSKRSPGAGSYVSKSSPGVVRVGCDVQSRDALVVTYERLRCLEDQRRKLPPSHAASTSASTSSSPYQQQPVSYV